MISCAAVSPLLIKIVNEIKRIKQYLTFMQYQILQFANSKCKARLLNLPFFYFDKHRFYCYSISMTTKVMKIWMTVIFAVQTVIILAIIKFSFVK
ncbi:MAG TPA: hypothetical protein DCQ99_04295 [Nitrospinae bacterium]|nr:hypothetical protein [Nitrospinota bacterium]